MKIWKINTVALLVSIIFVCQVDAKPGGKSKGGGKPGGEEPPPATTSCADKGSAFPAFAYTVQNSNRKGVTGHDFYLSNADADCAVKIHSTSYAGHLGFSYSQNGDNGVIVWTQSGNENAGRKDVDRYYDRLKMIRFQTAAKEVTSSRPLSQTEIASSGKNNKGFLYIDLSADANKILVSVSDASGTEEVNTIEEIDVSSCSSNCSMSSILSKIGLGFAGVSYSSFGDRIYFSSMFLENSTDPRAGQNYIAFIEQNGSSWTTPRLVTLEGNNLHGDVRFFMLPTVAIADLGNGPTEVMAFHYRRDGGEHQIQIIDIDTCATAGSGDCLSTGESSIVRDILDAEKASFDNTFDANSLLFTTNSGIIMSHDLISGAETDLGNGHQVGSGN